MSRLLVGLRRGVVPIVLGIVCWVAAAPAIEDLDPLLKVAGSILVVLGLMITVATARAVPGDYRRETDPPA